MKQLLAEPAQGKITSRQRLLAATGAEVCCHRDVARRTGPVHAVGRGGVLLRSWRLWRQQKHDNQSASVDAAQGRSAARTPHMTANDEVERPDDLAGSAPRLHGPLQPMVRRQDPV